MTKTNNYPNLSENSEQLMCEKETEALMDYLTQGIHLEIMSKYGLDKWLIDGVEQ